VLLEKIKKLATTKPIRNALRDTAHSQTHNNAYSLWRVNGCQQGFRFVASFGFGGQESASKPPQAICKPLAESKELIKIKKRYAKLVTDIESVESDKEKLIASNNRLLKLLDELKSYITTTQSESEKIKNLNNQIQNLYNQITANAEDIESKKVTISSLHKSAKELEQIFEDANSQVKEINNSSSKSVNEFIQQKN
jgi:uncharacterized protein YoxC